MEMLASRPSTSSARAESEDDTAVHEEKRIPGVHADTLREERKPLLDLEDVERLESELAACFDAPPPPPLSIHQQPTATVSSWTPSLEPRYLENQRVPLPATSEETSAVSATAATGTESQERREHEAEQATRISDLSNLYMPAPEREPSSRQLYPALIPTAPSSEATRESVSSGAERRTEAAGAQPATTPSSVAMLDNDVATSGVTTAAAGLSALAAVRDRGGAASRAAAGESSVEVVEELLSENERLRFIIQEMSDELDRVSRQLQNRGRGAQQSGVPVVPTEAAAEASSQSQQRGTTHALAAAAASSRSQMAQYPGAAAEASRRRREQEAEQNRQVQQQRQQQQPSLRRGVFVHFKCENCPQWLKVPTHAQLVFCPTCSHTSQMTANSTIHFPANNGVMVSSSRRSESSSMNAASQEDQTSWTQYFRRLIPS